jgi:hypothetical protein
VTGCSLGFWVVFEPLDPPSYESMAPMPYANASMRRKNGFVKSGCWSTGLLTMAFCSVSVTADAVSP